MSGSEVWELLPRRRRWRRLLAVGAGLALVVVVSWSSTRSDMPSERLPVDSEENQPAVPQPTMSPGRSVLQPGLHGGTWSPLPDAPVPGSIEAGVAWSGDEIFVMRHPLDGPGDQQEDQHLVLYDHAVGEWQRLRPPRDPELPAVPYQVVWASDRFLVVGSTDDGRLALAGFDPEDGSWVQLTPPPSEGPPSAAAWTGDQLILWGTSDLERARRGSVPGRGWQYSASEDDWEELPPSPIDDALGQQLVWTGSEVLIWGGVAEEHLGAMFDPEEQRWQLLPAAPGGPRSGHTMIPAGASVLVWGGTNVDGRGDPRGLALDLDQQAWEHLPAGPIETRIGHAAVWTGREMIVWGGSTVQPLNRRRLGDGAAYDPTREVWQRLPAYPLSPRDAPNAVWTGREVLIWGGFAGAPLSSGASYQPILQP